MRIAITGGTGFIGQSLELRLAAACDAERVLSRRPSNRTGFPNAVKV
jgi:nucleoside-diphosphate-sugar epimerase